MTNSFLKENTDILYDFPFDLQKENLHNLLNFYSSDNQVCFLEGQTGCFKTELLDYSCRYLKDNVLLFKFKCFGFNLSLAIS